MRILNNDPFRWVFFHEFSRLVIGCACFALYQIPDIHLCGENPPDGKIRPPGCFMRFEYALKIAALRMLVFHWVKNTHAVQPVRNRTDADAVLVHGKDKAHDFPRILVHHKLIPVVLIFAIAVWRKGFPHIRPCAALHPSCCGF